MIAELLNKNRGFIEKNPSRELALLRIKALFKVYGLGRSFIKFYSNETGEVLICIQNNAAFLHIAKAENISLLAAEAAGFLSMTVNEIMTQTPLNLEGYELFSGNIYALKKWENITLQNTSDSLQEGYNLLSKIFTDCINSTTYNSWYTDMSHRIRHGMSKIYSYDGACSATVYLNDKGTIVIAQLGTIKEKRGMGYAKKLLYHIAANTKNTKEVLLFSQDEHSDKFYEHIGFKPVGKWYSYER